MTKNWKAPRVEAIGLDLTEGGTNILKRDLNVLDGNLVDLVELGSGNTDNTISGEVPGPIVDNP